MPFFADTGAVREEEAPYRIAKVANSRVAREGRPSAANDVGAVMVDEIVSRHAVAGGSNQLELTDRAASRAVAGRGEIETSLDCCANVLDGPARLAAQTAVSVFTSVADALAGNAQKGHDVVVVAGRAKRVAGIGGGQQEIVLEAGQTNEDVSEILISAVLAVRVMVPTHSTFSRIVNCRKI